MPPDVRTVLIVDDDPSFRGLLRQLVQDSGLEVVGEAVNGAEGVALVDALAPDLVTMDLEMPVMSGVEAITSICSRADCPEIVVVSGSLSSDHLGEALAAGARWHVPKRDVVQQLPAVLGGLVGARHRLVPR